MPPTFAKRESVLQVEEGKSLAPKFGADGTLPVVTTDANTGEVLMLGYMNEAALQETLATKQACYFSRARQELWRKGATSGLVQHVQELRIDDDQDAIWLKVIVDGGASCHVGYRSCFYRSVPLAQDGAQWQLQFEDSEKVFDPDEVYGAGHNPTKL